MRLKDFCKKKFAVLHSEIRKAALRRLHWNKLVKKMKAYAMEMTEERNF